MTARHLRLPAPFVFVVPNCHDLKLPGRPTSARERLRRLQTVKVTPHHRLARLALLLWTLSWAFLLQACHCVGTERKLNRLVRSLLRSLHPSMLFSSRQLSRVGPTALLW